MDYLINTAALAQGLEFRDHAEAADFADHHGGEIVSVDTERQALAIDPGAIPITYHPEAVTLINCTPHPVVLMGEDGKQVVLPPSGIVPRRTEKIFHGRPVRYAGATIPTGALYFGAVEGLPTEAPGVLLIVSRIVADAAGRVLGCKALYR